MAAMAAGRPAAAEFDGTAVTDMEQMQLAPPGNLLSVPYQLTSGTYSAPASPGSDGRAALYLTAPPSPKRAGSRLAAAGGGEKPRRKAPPGCCGRPPSTTKKSLAAIEDVDEMVREQGAVLAELVGTVAELRREVADRLWATGPGQIRDPAVAVAVEGRPPPTPHPHTPHTHHCALSLLRACGR